MNNVEKLKEKIKEFSNQQQGYTKDYLLYEEILELCAR